MADPDFRAQQWESRYEPHVAPINHLVDSLERIPTHARPPYVAPMYGGVHARLLSFLRDPGPATQKRRARGKVGSGFLCMENDDPTAERVCTLFAAVGIPAREIVPWNAYPWYINRNPLAHELDEGVAPLKQIVDLLANLKVVILHGGAAMNSWERFRKRYPTLESERGIQVLATYHASRQAFWHPSAEERTRRLRHLEDTFACAAEILGYASARENV